MPRSKIPEMVARIGEIGESLNLGTCAFGHAGDGNLYVQVLFDEEHEMDRVQNAIDQVLRKRLSSGAPLPASMASVLQNKSTLLGSKVRVFSACKENQKSFRSSKSTQSR